MTNRKQKCLLVASAVSSIALNRRIVEETWSVRREGFRVPVLGDVASVVVVARFATFRHGEAGTALVLLRQRLHVVGVAVERRVIPFAILAMIVLLWFRWFYIDRRGSVLSGLFR